MTGRKTRSQPAVIFTTDEHRRTEPVVQLICRSHHVRANDLLEGSRRVVPFGSGAVPPVVPIATWRLLFDRPDLTLHIEHPKLDTSITQLTRAELKNSFRMIDRRPLVFHPLGPLPARCLLVDGVELTSDIDAPELRAAVAAILTGGK